jgi:hypothetical protein
MQRDCYDPATGRFCEGDPIGLRGGINTYLYVLASPLLFVDTDGLRIGGLPSQSPEDLLKGGPERQGQQLSGKAMGVIYGTQCALGCKQGRVQWVVDNALMTCLEIIPAGILASTLRNEVLFSCESTCKEQAPKICPKTSCIPSNPSL